MARNPISPADMGKSPLRMAAKALNCAVSNAVIARYHTYTAFCDALRSSPVRPGWIFENKPTSKKCQGQERSECGKYFGINARKTAGWDLLDWIVRQVTAAEDVDARRREWARDWTAATGKAVPCNDIGDIGLVRELERERDALRCRVDALTEDLDAAVADRDRAVHDVDSLAAAGRGLQERLAKVTAGNIALDKARERERVQFKAVHRNLLDELSKLGTELRSLTDQAGARQQDTALLLAFLASVDSRVKAEIALTSFGLRSHVTASVSTCLPPALAALLDLDFDAEADRFARRFAIYVHALLLGDGTRPLALSRVAASTGISAPVLASILNGQCLPTPAQLQDIIGHCPAVGVHGPALLTDAHSSQLAGVLAAPNQAAVTTPRHAVGAKSPVRLALPVSPAASRRTPVSDVVSSSRRPGWTKVLHPRRSRPDAVRPEPPLFSAGPFRVVSSSSVRRAGRARRPVAVALAITVSAAVPLLWLAGSIGSRLGFPQATIIGADLAVLGGDTPATLQTERGDFTGMAWAGVSHGTPQATTFQPVRRTTPYRGLRGLLWLQHTPGCSPAVAVRVHTAGEVDRVSLLRDNVVDLAVDVDVEPSWNNRFRVELTRVDTDFCPVTVVWSEAGTR